MTALCRICSLDLPIRSYIFACAVSCGSCPCIPCFTTAGLYPLLLPSGHIPLSRLTLLSAAVPHLPWALGLPGSACPHPSRFFLPTSFVSSGFRSLCLLQRCTHQMFLVDLPAAAIGLTPAAAPHAPDVSPGPLWSRRLRLRAPAWPWTPSPGSTKSPHPRTASRPHPR